MSPDAIRERIRAALPDAQVELEDLTGTADHWKARIVSAVFAGRSPIERHRLINRALACELAGPINALTMELYAPGEPPAT
jgi:phosphoribosylformylglycinamidine synthase